MIRKWWTLVAVCIGVFMLLLDLTIVNVALPDIEHAFRASLSDLQWVLDAYALTLAALLLTAGSLADRFGRRLLFATGIAVFTAGSLLCGVATGPLFLSLARGFQGIGGAVMFSTSLSLLANAFQGRERGVALGVFGAITGVAVAVGPVIGGVITSDLSWRWIFYVNIPIGIVALALTLSRVDESRDPRGRRVDWAGFATFSAGLAAVIFALIRSTADGWSSREVLGSLAAGAVLLASFVLVELAGENPMFDLSLLRKPAFTGGLVAAFGINGSLFALLTYLVLYMQNVLGLSALQTGLRFLVLTGGIFATAGLAGRLTARVPARWLIAPGFVFVGAGILLMTGISAESSWSHLIPGFVLAGLGAGFVNVPLASTAVGVVEPARSGMASGINSTFRQVGTATGIAALGSIFASRLRSTVVSNLAATPLHPVAPAIANGIVNGQTAAPHGTSAAAAALVRSAADAGLVNGLNEVLVIGAVVSFAAAVLSLVLIRPRDFHAAHASAPSQAPAEAALREPAFELVPETI